MKSNKNHGNWNCVRFIEKGQHSGICTFSDRYSLDFECDEGSIKNKVWDGLVVDKIINDQGLCWVDMGDESAEWRQCLP